MSGRRIAASTRSASRAIHLHAAARRIGRTLIALGLASAAAGCAGGLSATDAWIRLLPGDLPAGGYFVLRNDGDQTATLVGASARDFASVALHRSVERGGLQTMVPVDSVPVPAHGEVAFRPGDYHLMLMHARRPLAVGGTERITLRMADGTEIPVDFEIRGPAGTGGQ